MFFRILSFGIFLGIPSSAMAEVGDKQPSIGVVLAAALALNLLAIVLERIRPKLGLIVLPIAAVLVWGAHMELTDPYVGPAILDELGESYITTSYLAFALALLGPIIIVALFGKFRRRRD